MRATASSPVWQARRTRSGLGEGETGTPLRRAARPLALLSVEPHPPLLRGWHRALASGPVAGSASYTLRSGCDVPAIIPGYAPSAQGGAVAVQSILTTGVFRDRTCRRSRC